MINKAIKTRYIYISQIKTILAVRQGFDEFRINTPLHDINSAQKNVSEVLNRSYFEASGGLEYDT